MGKREWVLEFQDFYELEHYDPRLAKELKNAYDAGHIKGLVVKTRIDGRGNVLGDPEFIEKELSEIGKSTF